MEEIWIDIKDYEGTYQVSNMGVVKSLDRKVYYSDRKLPRVWGGGIIKPWVCNSGYSSVTLKKQGRRSNRMIHRLVAQHFIQNPNESPQVNHKDNNKANNNVDNLEWCDQFKNMRHAFNNNFHSGKGKTHYLARRVVDIKTKECYNTLTSAAKSVGISVPRLCHMLNGRDPNETTLRYLK